MNPADRKSDLWQRLGAHTDGESGTRFAVWAPGAREVRVAGDFNGWDSTQAPMSRDDSGVWHAYLPDAQEGHHYKYDVHGADGSWKLKADPMAYRTQVPPETASVIHRSRHLWRDADWISERASRPPHASAMSVYEVHLGSWRHGKSYRELADELVAYVADMGFTHVELMPVMEHPYGGSWGYQVTSYFSPTARFGDPDDLRLLIDRFHQAGIGVLLDWVPAHFPKDDWALARFDGTALYEHADPKRAEHPEWGTYTFDYGRPEVREFLIASALYWLEEFHADGLRVDAVASMLYLDYSRRPGQWSPNIHGGREDLDAVTFLRELNEICYTRNPGVVIIAEESTAWPGVTRPTSAGGLGFGLKWNMGWMHDTLAYCREEPAHRRHHHTKLTFAMMYAYAENYLLPLSHDEVVHGKGSLLNKMSGDRWKKFATLRAYLAYTWAFPGKQLLFMGGELAQEREWAEERSLDWHVLEDPYHHGVRDLVRDLNLAYTHTGALWSRDAEPSGFTWIDADDAERATVTFCRCGSDGSVVACLANFSAGPHDDVRVGLPRAGTWQEVLNTDAEVYGGSGVGNLGQIRAEDEPYQGQPASATVRLPPLGTVWLRHVDS